MGTSNSTGVTPSPLNFSCLVVLYATRHQHWHRDYDATGAEHNAADQFTNIQGRVESDRRPVNHLYVFVKSSHENGSLGRYISNENADHSQNDQTKTEPKVYLRWKKRVLDSVRDI